MKSWKSRKHYWKLNDIYFLNYSNNSFILICLTYFGLFLKKSVIMNLYIWQSKRHLSSFHCKSYLISLIFHFPFYEILQRFCYFFICFSLWSPLIAWLLWGKSCLISVFVSLFLVCFHFHFVLCFVSVWFCFFTCHYFVWSDFNLLVHKNFGCRHFSLTWFFFKTYTT